MSTGIPIDGKGGRDFKVTRRDRIGGNLAMDRGEGQAEMVLGGAEEAEYDMD